MSITSKTFGTHKVMLDNADFERLQQLGGKWCLAKKRGKYYVQKRINGKIIELQRYLLNPPKNKRVDHINGDTLNNRRKNLRICTNAANLRNGRLRSNNTSGYKGIWIDKRNGRWVAEIKVNYKKISIGRFDYFEDAVLARKEAESQYWSV